MSEAVVGAVVTLLRDNLGGEIGIALLASEPKEWIGKASTLLGDKGEGWLDEVLDKGGELLDAEADGDVAKAGHEGLELLKANKKPFMRLGNVGLAWVAANFEEGDALEAKRFYIAHTATYQERRDFMHQSTDAIIDWTAEASDAWDAVADVLGKVGNVALKLIVKAALGTVGLSGLAPA